MIKKSEFSKIDVEALVLGRISLVRSLGRVGIPIILAREGRQVFERSSRYVRKFIELPNIQKYPEQALEILINYGRILSAKPVTFFNGESDVMLFSEYRNVLKEFYHIILPDHHLVSRLVNKQKFWQLAKELNLSVPQTFTPVTESEMYDMGAKIGYPCLLKPIRQQIWHQPEYYNSIVYRKAILVNDADELKSILAIMPPIKGEVMVQQYIPGDDTNHFDHHSYIDKKRIVRGSIVGHKIRTYPIHFGQGCYTHYLEEPAIEALCLDALTKIGYIGAANINTKRHSETGRDYILEINPRFSLWTIFDSICGVNMPLLQYLDALDMEIPQSVPSGKRRRWLSLGTDFKSMLAYRKCGELSIGGWIKSFYTYKGKIEHHIFAPDDPGPFFDNLIIKTAQQLKRIANFVYRKRQI